MLLKWHRDGHRCAIAGPARAGAGRGLFRCGQARAGAGVMLLWRGQARARAVLARAGAAGLVPRPTGSP